MIGLLFNWRIWAAVVIAVALAASHWRAYTNGKKSVQADWDKATLLANDTARETERLNRMSKEKAIEERTKQIMANVASANAARVAAERLRGSSERSIQAARSDPASCIVSATAHAQLFDSCQRAYRSLAEAADGHATDVKALIEAWPK